MSALDTYWKYFKSVPALCSIQIGKGWSALYNMLGQVTTMQFLDL